MDTAKEEKIFKLETWLKHTQMKLHRNQYELNSRTEWLCDLEEDVAQYNKLIAEQRTILHEIQGSIPGFDIEVCNKYKKYGEIQSRIDEHKIKLDSLIQNREIKKSEILEKQNEKRKLEAEIAKIEQELAQLKTE